MIYIAPVQGHTDAPWRHFHQSVYGGDLRYFTPFVHYERGQARPRDLRDFTSPLNGNHHPEPQIIFRNMEELRVLAASLAESGASEINLNMGCPFPLQTGKGRGAAIVANTAEIARLPETLAEFPHISFSVKMRLGQADPYEWKDIMHILNDLPLRFIALHPRVGRQQYGGDLHLQSFNEFCSQCHHPVIFNGEIREPAHYARAIEATPGAAGIMIARGILARPSLSSEIMQGRCWSRQERIDEMLRFHRLLLDHYSSVLCGEAQVLSKIKPFWEYAEEEIGHASMKAIKKAGNMARYTSAISGIQ